jgi:hypothetical protein
MKIFAPKGGGVHTVGTYVCDWRRKAENGL